MRQIGPQLVSLKLKGARIIEGATFRDMVCRFQSMKYLSLDGTFYVKSDAMSALASAGQQLQEVCAGFHKPSGICSRGPLPRRRLTQRSSETVSRLRSTLAISPL